MFRIQETIRRLLHLIPTDPAILEVLEKVASRRSAASAFSTAAAFDADIRPRPVGGLNVLNASNANSPFTRIPPTVVGHAAITTSPTKGRLMFGKFSKVFQVGSSIHNGFALILGLPTSSVTPKPSGLASSIRSASFRPLPQHFAAVKKCETKESVEELLRGLLNPSASTMSPFRVLYNLEVKSEAIEFRICQLSCHLSICHYRFCRGN